MIDFSFIYTSRNNNQISKRSRDFFETLYSADQIETIHEDRYCLTMVKDGKAIPVQNFLHYGSPNYLLLLMGDLRINDHVPGVINEDALLENAAKVLNNKEFYKLDGNFLILSVDAAASEIKIINSKLGLIPCYYYSQGDEIIISTRLGLFKYVIDELMINWGAVAQYSLYNYVISDVTFYKSIYTLFPAGILSFKTNAFSLSSYWSIEDEMIDRPLNFSESVNLLDNALNEIFLDILEEGKKIAISLTGGWDGRILLAYASKFLQNDHIVLYSFGSKDSPDVWIPSENAGNLGYQYLPIDLGQGEYAEAISSWAAETIYRSDGLRSAIRSHYLYSMNYLQDKADFAITGIGGSNLIKSKDYQPSNVYNQWVLELMLSEGFEKVLKQHFSYLKENYPEFFIELSEKEFIDSFNTQRINSLFGLYSPKKRMFHFLIGDVERKYFGYELMSYRHMMTNCAPFFDMRFIKALAKTTLLGGYTSGTTGSNFLKSAYLYAKLVNRNAPKLAKQKTDRGFSFHDLLHPFNPNMIIRYVNMKKKVKNKSGDYFRNKEILKKMASVYLGDYKEITEKYPQDEFTANYLSTILYLRKLGENL